MNKKICKKCNKEYIPDYPIQRLNDKSIYCKECVEEILNNPEIIFELNKDSKKALDD